MIDVWDWNSKSKLLITNGEIVFFFNFKLNKKNRSSRTNGKIVFLKNQMTKNALKK
jgi:hypothetical protein